jgi:hypothetical protein
MDLSRLRQNGILWVGYLIIIKMQAGLRVGWIGTGVMGLSMCKHLLNANYKLAVYTRTATKAKPLLDLGADWLEPKELASQVDVLFLMLGFPKDVETMVLGEEGLLRHMKKGYQVTYLDQFWLTILPANPTSLKKSTLKLSNWVLAAWMRLFRVAMLGLGKESW